MNRKKKFLYLFFFLPALVYVPLFHGEYLFDDISHVSENPELISVDSLSEAIDFTLQPSRPISNFSLALIHWGGKGSLLVHRAVSLGLHLLVCLLLFLNLRLLTERLKIYTFRPLVGCVCLLFGVSPLLSEVLSVVVFRWEILGTLFSLSCAYCIQKIAVSSQKEINRPGLWLMAFVLFGMATLTKESYGLFTWALCVAVWLGPKKLSLSGYKQKENLKPILWISALAGFWLVPLSFLLLKPTSFPYVGFIGFDGGDLSSHLHYSGRAFIEHWVKLFLGSHLTTLRLNLRAGLASEWSTSFTVGLQLATLVGLLFLCRKKGWLQIWVPLFVLSSYFYYLIPNKNIGSEHYYYFSSVCAYCVIVYGVWSLSQKWTPQPKNMTWILCLLYGSYLTFQLSNRVDELSSRLKEAKAIVRLNPESAIGWTQVSSSLLENKQTVPEAKFYIDRAKQIAPHYFRTFTNELVYYLQMKEFGKAEALLPKADSFSREPPREIAFIYYYFAKEVLLHGYCQKANHYMNVAMRRDSTFEFFKSEARNIASLVAENPQRCRDSN